MKYANQTGAFLKNDYFTWVQGVYEWSHLFAYYKLWFVVIFKNFFSIYGKICHKFDMAKKYILAKHLKIF